MANQVPMTADEVARYIGVPDVDSLKWSKAIYAGANALRVAFVVFETGGAIVAMSGIFAPVLGIVAVFLSLGIPVMEAKAHVAKKAARHGYSIGVVAGCFGFQRYFVSGLFDNTNGSPGVAPSYMTGIYKQAFNAALAMGYCSAWQLTAEEKEKIRTNISKYLFGDAKKGGYKLYMDGWTDRDWVFNYARAMNNHMLSD